MKNAEYIPAVLASDSPVLLLCEAEKLDEVSKLAREHRPTSVFLGEIRNSLDFFKFFEANFDKDIVVVMDGPAGKDPVVLNLLKSFLMASPVSWSSMVYSSKFTYTGRCTVVAAKAEESIKSRTLYVEV